MVEHVVGLNLNLQHPLFAAERDVLCHRHVEVGFARKGQVAGTAALVTQNRRSDNRIVRPRSQRGHGISVRIEEYLPVAIGRYIAQRIAQNIATLSDVTRARITAGHGCRPRSQTTTRVIRCAGLVGSDSGVLPMIGDNAERLEARRLTEARDIVVVVDGQVVAPVVP